MNSSDIISTKSTSFDNKKYYRLQKKAIIERMEKFIKGRLYLEIGGKFLYDPHANRVIPGFDPTIKQKVLADLIPNADILFCVDYKDIISNRQLKNTHEDYIDTVFNYLTQISKNLSKKPTIVINRCTRGKIQQNLDLFVKRATTSGYEVIKRYFIKGYPTNTKAVLSLDGFGADEYFKTNKKLVIVTGAGSNSGKMSTCLGQIYNDCINGFASGYAKYELFPIWNKDLNHPVNLAYEAATADIGDYNVWDKLHEKAYGIKAVNYNRDMSSFKLIKSLTRNLLDKTNFMRSYKSPTDMGINMAGECIVDDLAVCHASVDEIGRRAQWYKDAILRGEGKINWVSRCYALEIKAISFIKRNL